MHTAQGLSPALFVKHASDVAMFYGFKPFRHIEQELKQKREKGNHTFTSTIDTCARHTQLRNPEPSLAFYASAAPSHVPPGIVEREVGEFGLHVVGAQDSLGEILLLKTLFSILSEWGTQVARVRVNALGDRDSKLRFERELTLYVRKHAHLMDDSCKKALASNPLGMYVCTNDSCKQVLHEGPRAMNFLSEKSRAHFREVLEYVESLGLPYELDDLLIGDEREPRVVFALDLVALDATVVAGVGGRYDEYVRRRTNRKDGHAVSASIFFKKKGMVKSGFVVTPIAQAPKVYFVQLGLRAKLQGLTVVDMFRQAHVPVAQSFDPKSLAPQLQCARDQGVSHLLIMGQREALDGTIIVRSTTNSSQQILALSMLPRFLKTLKV